MNLNLATKTLCNLNLINNVSSFPAMRQRMFPTTTFLFSMFSYADTVVLQSDENANHAHQNTQAGLLKGQSHQQVNGIHVCLVARSAFIWGNNLLLCTPKTIKNANIKFTVVPGIPIQCADAARS